MSYDALEYSTQDATPNYRFLFSIGSVEYGFTTAADIATDSNSTYIPAPIIAGEVNQSNEMAKDPLKLKFPRDNVFAQQFLGGVPDQVTTVTVFRGHITDTGEDYQFYWKGRVAGASASGDEVSIDCENIFTSMRRPGLSARYQKTCRHALYSTKCGVDSASFALVATATAVSGSTVTVDSVSSVGDAIDYFVGGTLETSNGELRYITNQVGSVLTIMYPISSLTEEVNDGSAGQSTITLYPGCDHTRDVCVSKFDNVVNFGGFPWIPSKNPFNGNVTGSIA